MKGYAYNEIREKWLHHIFEIFSTSEDSENSNKNNKSLSLE